MNLGKFATFRTISTCLICGLLLACVTSLAAAQSDALPPPPPPGAMMHGPGPGGMMHDGIGDKVVTGVPLSADLVTTRDTTLADGNHIHSQNQTKIYRDADGRVRREVGFELDTPATGAARHRMVIITDPVAGKRYMLNPENKTARVMSLHPKHGGPTPPDRPGGPKHDDSNVVREQLGTKAVNGLQAEGTRVTRTIPAGKIGNDKDIQVVTERWFSTDLQLPLTTTHSDPMMGSMTTNLTNINRTAPDPSLFQVPSDYKVETGKQGEAMYMPMRP